MCSRVICSLGLTEANVVLWHLEALGSLGGY